MLSNQSFRCVAHPDVVHYDPGPPLRYGCGVPRPVSFREAQSREAEQDGLQQGTEIYKKTGRPLLVRFMNRTLCMAFAELSITTSLGDGHAPDPLGRPRRLLKRDPPAPQDHRGSGQQPHRRTRTSRGSHGQDTWRQASAVSAARAARRDPHGHARNSPEARILEQERKPARW